MKSRRVVCPKGEKCQSVVCEHKHNHEYNIKICGIAIGGCPQCILVSQCEKDDLIYGHKRD
jgi:hypothetical protein